MKTWESFVRAVELVGEILAERITFVLGVAVFQRFGASQILSPALRDLAHFLVESQISNLQGGPKK